MGYAFINLKFQKDIPDFYNFFHLKKWDLFKSRKVYYLLIRFVNLLTQEFKAKMNLKSIFRIQIILNNLIIRNNKLSFLNKNS
jgi:hypothetical protein